MLDYLVTDRNSPGWVATLPPGMEGDSLVMVLEEFLTFLYQSLHSNVDSGAVLPEEADVSAFRGRLGKYIPYVIFPHRGRIYNNHSLIPLIVGYYNCVDIVLY